MADVFDRIYGQPQVREFLRATLASGRINHAYLFTGMAGSNKTAAALAFAQSLVCEHGGCEDCDECTRAKRGKHPDVHLITPAGASGYLIEQVREIVDDCSLAPIRAKRKVYIIDRADLLGTYAANAFLKTLEEPQPDVVLILLGRTVEAVLPTIVSRCQVVPFRQIPATEAAGIVSQNAGVSRERARFAIEACNGSVSRALEFVRSADRMAFRARIMEIMESLRTADDLDIIDYASEILALAKAPLDAVRAEQERELDNSSEFLSNAARKRLEQRNKSTLSMKTFEYLRQTTGIVRSWLRDVLMVAEGAADLVINQDVRQGIDEAAAYATPAGIAQALRAADRADEAIAYNVSPETCIDVLLIDIREALYGTNCTS